MNVYSDGSMRPAPDGNDQASEDEEDDDDEDDSQRNEWEFRFALLVEGQDSQTMRLIVDDKSAQFLLNMDPTEYVILAILYFAFRNESILTNHALPQSQSRLRCPLSTPRKALRPLGRP